jgi:hypothetical protein
LVTKLYLQAFCAPWRKPGAGHGGSKISHVEGDGGICRARGLAVVTPHDSACQSPGPGFFLRAKGKEIGRLVKKYDDP